ncbi:5-oxoprolinase subunit B family protein [Nakamurella leprariae]|uniref:Carboxyltransferase domain-containing protein n=1 Tax=Nakamurella leprariae TaxID=2803911 RepID=A0A939BZX0_9ACTN|nr:carboxyltransferase domain-containing protein [Nakamurella leprariae]MBM9468161.1 carboxyltransferase domain-containing protein [Nakamurella leprariae]
MTEPDRRGPVPVGIHRAGDRGWLVDVPADLIRPLTDRLAVGPWAERLAAVVPAAATVLVTVRDATDMPSLRTHLAGLVEPGAFTTAGTGPAATVAELVVPVRYDGPDLAEVARRCGCSVDAVVAAHTGAVHTVGFFGFAPGFAYLDGLPAALALPRRDDPRTSIDAGTVAIAGRQSIVYPGGTPGGWHLLGHTDVRLWDLDRDPPALLAVGDRVRFRAAGQ